MQLNPAESGASARDPFYDLTLQAYLAAHELGINPEEQDENPEYTDKVTGWVVENGLTFRRFIDAQEPKVLDTWDKGDPESLTDFYRAFDAHREARRGEQTLH